MNVTELMTPNVNTCRVGESLADAAKTMWDREVGFVLVIDADGRLAGMLSDRDACMGAYTTGRPLHEILVEQAMVRDVATCHPDEPLRAAEELMRTRRVRRIPVVDQHRRPVGMLSVDDLARNYEPTPDSMGSSELAGDTVAFVLSGIARSEAAPATVRAAR